MLAPTPTLVLVEYSHESCQSFAQPPAFSCTHNQQAFVSSGPRSCTLGLCWLLPYRRKRTAQIRRPERIL